jgi:uncharacterized protein (TIGR02646 family)
MIKLRRPDVTPPTLRAGGKGAVAAADNQERKNIDSNAAIEFDPHWCEADVRGALYAMQGWVCAYCQRKIDPRDTKHVDHFRPKKGGYWWLAYLFKNYFLTCSLCNERKGELFPINDGSQQATYETRNLLLEEARLLIDPAEDPVSQWLTVSVDDGEHHGEVVARSLDTNFTAANRVRTTIKLFALNEDDDHLQERIRLIEKLTKAHKEGKTKKLTRLASRYHAHSFTTRSFLEAYAPELLPHAEKELRRFLKKLCKRLKSALDLRDRRGGTSSSCMRRAREIAWTIAVLWKDPPVGTAEDVANCLDEMECRKLVERNYKKLLQSPQ